MKYSIIIPVFNRPGEIRELFESLTRQCAGDFEVILVEDGSEENSDGIAAEFSDRLRVKYAAKKNEGPGPARNFGAKLSQGEWLVILDSDVELPPDYFKTIEKELSAGDCDAFGGPDMASDDYSPIQKAVSYAMTSFFTTGGIRGGKRKMDKFYPRSFNMGVRREVFRTLGGFGRMRFGEDIDFSIRLLKAGYVCRLFPQAAVFHKRRTDLRKFFRQVHNSGMARVSLYKKYPDSLKPVHLLPAAFTLGLALALPALPLSAFLPFLAILPGLFSIYAIMVFADASLRHRSLKVGALSVAASFVQLTGYGSGFIRAWWRLCILGADEAESLNRPLQ